jgi:glyoxylase-like metal-dependent hydrolase (beta-lactamase superfamily II)
MFGNLKFTSHLSPGHTVGHMYFVLDGSPFGATDHVFSGDHLFLGGCGKCIFHLTVSHLEPLALRS